ncbi:MAG: hypothetical protein OHK0037_07010 [Elainellaceae cyanobacterium]
MIKHSGVRTIPNIRVVVVAMIAGQAQRLQIKIQKQILQPVLRQLLSPPPDMQPWLLMRRSGRWDAANFFKALWFKGAGAFACGG